MKQLNSFEIAMLSFIQKTSSISESVRFLIQAENVAHSNPKLNEHYETLNTKLAESNLNFMSYFFSNFHISLVSALEIYFIDIVKCVIAINPEKIGKHQISISDIIENTKEDVIDGAAESYIHGILYKRPAEYLKEIDAILSINSKEIGEFLTEYIEFKARRDIGVHNAWKVNKIYLQKASEIKYQHKFVIGDSIYPDNDYLLRVSLVCTKIALFYHQKIQKKYNKALHLTNCK